MTALPVACQLTDAEFRARRNGILSTVRGMVVSAAWKGEGLTLELPASPAALASALELIAAERACCPFLRFDLQTGPGDAPTRLTITGPNGSQEFLETFGLAEKSR